MFRPYSPKSPPLLPPHWQEQAVATTATFPAMQSVRNPLRRALPSLVSGPELVYFNGGETVLTAPETRAAFDEAQQFTQIVSKKRPF